MLTLSSPIGAQVKCSDGLLSSDASSLLILLIAFPETSIGLHDAWLTRPVDDDAADATGSRLDLASADGSIVP